MTPLPPFLHLRVDFIIVLNDVPPYYNALAQCPSHNSLVYLWWGRPGHFQVSNPLCDYWRFEQFPLFTSKTSPVHFWLVICCNPTFRHPWGSPVTHSHSSLQENLPLIWRQVTVFRCATISETHIVQSVSQQLVLELYQNSDDSHHHYHLLYSGALASSLPCSWTKRQNDKMTEWHPSLLSTPPLHRSTSLFPALQLDDSPWCWSWSRGTSHLQVGCNHSPGFDFYYPLSIWLRSSILGHLSRWAPCAWKDVCRKQDGCQGTAREGCCQVVWLDGQLDGDPIMFEWLSDHGLMVV